MHPRLFTTEYFTLHTFGLILVVAFVAALICLLKGAKREGLNADLVLSLGIWAIGGAILGAKLLYVLRNLSDFTGHPVELFSLSFLETAGDFYGGFLGALISSAIYFKRHPELPVWLTADLCAPAIALGQAIGRIGCFMAGDDYGKATTVRWAVVFTDPDAARIGGAPLGVALHPVQLYESIACLILFFALVMLRTKKSFDGEVILGYALGYAVLRFILEYFRGDTDRGFVFNGLFSTSQFIALAIIVVSGFLFFRRFSARRTA